MDNKCSICFGFNEKETGYQKYGSENYNTYLPENAKKLIIIRDLKKGSSRLKQLKQCPECKKYYLYETDYEYLAFGSEDEEFLTRLTENEALILLDTNKI